MLLELNKPTLFNILALVSYALNMLFHVIAYGTNDWCHFTLHGQRVKLGLWNGCVHNQAHDTWECSDSVFGEDIFKSGKRLWSGKRKYGSDWHIGARVLMTCSLIVLFLLEFALISYACIRRLQIYRERLAGIVLGMSFALGGCTGVSIILYGGEANKHLRDHEIHLSSSFILAVCSFIFTIVTLTLILLERRQCHRPKWKDVLSMFTLRNSIADKLGTLERFQSEEYSRSSVFEREESFSNVSRPTVLLWLSSVNTDNTDRLSFSSLSESKQYGSELTVSTDIVSYFQEPVRRVSINSLESTV